VEQAASFQVETLLEKGSGNHNEDVLLNDSTLYGVFDGATSLVEDNLPAGLSGGLLAARIAAETFQLHATHYSLKRCAAMANDRIGLSLQACGIPAKQRHRLWSASAAVVRIGASSFDYCQTGDSLIFCLYENGDFSQLTPGTDHDMHTLSLWKKANPAPGATIRDTLADEILAIRLQMNSTYGVLNGEPEALSFLRCGREPLEGVSDLLLFTDGLFPPKEDPCAETDWREFVDLYRLGGLAALRDWVRSTQMKDPECRKYPRFKMHDDIAAIAVKL
jgi:hypothetical protein